MTATTIDTQDLWTVIALVESIATMIYDEQMGMTDKTHIDDVMEFVTESSPDEYDAYQRLKAQVQDRQP